MQTLEVDRNKRTGVRRALSSEEELCAAAGLISINKSHLGTQLGWAGPG